MLFVCRRVFLNQIFFVCSFLLLLNQRNFILSPTKKHSLNWNIGGIFAYLSRQSSSWHPDRIWTFRFHKKRERKHHQKIKNSFEWLGIAIKTSIALSILLFFFFFFWSSAGLKLVNSYQLNSHAIFFFRLHAWSIQFLAIAIRDFWFIFSSRKLIIYSIVLFVFPSSDLRCHQSPPYILLRSATLVFTWMRTRVVC